MSIKEFVSSLDREQLHHCVDLCKQRLEELASGPKVVVWTFSAFGANLFASQDGKEAMTWGSVWLSKRVSNGEYPTDFQLEESTMRKLEADEFCAALGATPLKATP